MLPVVQNSFQYLSRPGGSTIWFIVTAAAAAAAPTAASERARARAQP